MLVSHLPEVTSDSGYVTGLSMTLGKTFSFHGRRRSYVSASCPTPEGVPLASFPFARATFSFAGTDPITSTLIRTCRARG